MIAKSPKPGNYFTVQVGDYPVVVVRGRDGQIRAFHNSCRHRGSRVCTTDKGTSAKLVCPYHQWTYELDGKLSSPARWATISTRASFGLKPVHCETVGGYIFICLADEPPDFAPFRAHDRALSRAAPSARRQGRLREHDHREGQLEARLGKQPRVLPLRRQPSRTLPTFPEAPTVTGVQGAEDDPEIAGALGEVRGGRPAERVPHRPSRPVPRRPHAAAARCRELHHDRQARRPADSCPTTSRQTASARCCCSTTRRPGTTCSATTPSPSACCRSAPTETAVTTKWLVHKDAVEGVDYDLDELTHVWTETNDQDRRIVEENAFGIHSPAYEPGPYSRTA